MRLTRWIRNIRYSAYDRQGDLKYLMDRASDPSLCRVEGIPARIRDEALKLICESFDIPSRQMFCLRPDDELMAIYRSLVGPRTWDELQFERLGIGIDRKLSDREFLALKTVEDVVRAIAAAKSNRP